MARRQSYHGNTLGALDCLLASPSSEELDGLQRGGACASFEIPLLVEGECAGGFVCHHRTARIPSLEQQAAAELFAQMFGMLVAIETLRRSRP